MGSNSTTNDRKDHPGSRNCAGRGGPSLRGTHPGLRRGSSDQRPLPRATALLIDPERAARTAQLTYVRRINGGIQRLGSAGRFQYRLNGRVLKDKAVIARIHALAIPPAWKQVWICANPSGHLQATGIDARGRKQYRYHPDWSRMRGEVKFDHVMAFGAQLPAMRARLEKDMALPGLPLEKVLAMVVSVMESTHIRVGQESYARDNGSYGLSTLKDRHVTSVGGQVRFAFRGKTGIDHEIKLRSRKLSRLVLRCKELTGQDLFQYLDEAGKPHPITSGQVNDYIRSITNGLYTSKDIRTWKGTVLALEALVQQAVPSSATEAQRAINAALDLVAAQLGNTRSVCRKHYVHPGVLTAFAEGLLGDVLRGTRDTAHMPRHERIVLKLLHRKRSRAIAKAA